MLTRLHFFFFFLLPFFILSSIEISCTQVDHHSQIEKIGEKKQFCEVATSQNLPKQHECMINPLNPEAIALAEINAWKAYYNKDKIGLIKSITTLISQQYPLKNPKAWTEIIPPLGLAMYRFGNMPIGATQADYDSDVLPALTEAYKALGSHLHANWNSQEIAKNDLEWWIMRRKPSTHSPENVGSKIAQLYQKIFGNQDAHHFSRAGYLRATAARYRDICQLKWGSISENDWQTMQEILILSYKELDQGIKNQSLEKIKN